MEEVMKEIETQQLVDMNFRILLLLGYATSIVSDYKALSDYHDNADKCNWFFDAITEVIYKNKPLPPLP